MNSLHETEKRPALRWADHSSATGAPNDQYDRWHLECPGEAPPALQMSTEVYKFTNLTRQHGRRCGGSNRQPCIAAFSYIHCRLSSKISKKKSVSWGKKRIPFFFQDFEQQSPTVRQFLSRGAKQESRRGEDRLRPRTFAPCHGKPSRYHEVKKLILGNSRAARPVPAYYPTQVFRTVCKTVPHR